MPKAKKPSPSTAPILPLNQLVHVVRRLKTEGKTVAFTNGCFDLLHIGHLEYLKRIRQRTDCLIVGVNSDSSVRRIKGQGRPLVPELERARLVAGLKPVDYVAIFSEPTPLKMIRAIRPDLLAKGADWEVDRIVGRELVESYGGKVFTVPLVKEHSTTRLIRRIRHRT